MQSQHEPKTPRQLEEGNVPPLFDDAAHAFKTLLEESVLASLRRRYDPAITAPQAVRDYFMQNGKLDKRKIMKKVASLGLGIAATLFYAIPAQQAGEIILKLIKDNTGYDLPGGDSLSTFLQYDACIENLFINSYSANEMIDHYLGIKSEAIQYLTMHEATRAEKLQIYGRNILNLVCAIAASAPNYFLTQSAGILYASTTGIAAIGLNWMGVNNLELGPDSMHPAKRAELNYFHDQIETFIKLPFDEQNAILDELVLLDRHGHHDDHHFKKIYARLLNIAKPAGSSEDSLSSAVTLQEQHVASTAEKIIPKITGGAGFASEASFAGATFVGVQQLFNDPNSDGAYTAAGISALLALLPAIGFGGGGGYRAGQHLVSNNKELAELYDNKVRPVLRFLIKSFSAFSGGATFSTAYNISNTLLEALNITDPVKSIIAVSHAIYGHSGISTINSFYVCKMLDEIIVEFAKRCGNDKIQRLFNFVTEMREVENALEKMSEENFMELLKWKMTVTLVPKHDNDKQEMEREPVEHKHQHHEKKFKGLSDLLYALFDDRLTEKQFARTQDSLQKLNFQFRDRQHMPKYHLIPSFFKKEADEITQMRNRKPCNPFSRQDYVFKDNHSPV